jgi:hypothetical protein
MKATTATTTRFVGALDPKVSRPSGGTRLCSCRAALHRTAPCNGETPLLLSSSVAQAATRLGSAIQNLLHAEVLDAGAEADYRLDWVVVLVLVRHKAFDCMGHLMRRQ